jgi:cytochrome b6-f complex iron-sulfur subunit
MSCGEETVNQLTSRPANQTINRRGFLSWITKGTLIAAFGGLLYQAARFFSADVSTQPPHLFTLRPPADYALDTLTFEPAARVYIGRDARGLFAINATCTHLGCTVKNVGGGTLPTRFECPCHGSRFDAGGQVVTGPATRALERVRLTLAGDGHVIVDRAAVVNPDFRLAV